ncbi:Hypothetical protein SCLAV_1187 [Streptomyces clavuligerus]|uniref:Uncharacterized protein n=1 Tax=Streptomyces clavuligerus TaxID=1901 RepID=E2PYP3_STRCL|nr:Hypothetical protein SCLAV_1187 [Streptomyces clavuligerus]
MQIVFAAFAALAGVVAVLAGAYGLHRTRHITRSGRYAIALVKPPPPGAERPGLIVGCPSAAGGFERQLWPPASFSRSAASASSDARAPELSSDSEE